MVKFIAHTTPFLIVHDDDDGVDTYRYINLLRVKDIEISEHMISFYLNDDNVIEYVVAPSLLNKFRAEIDNTLDCINSCKIYR